MSFEHRPSPARVTEAAAAKLPRWMFFGLLAVYIVPGLFGRDPWSLEEASAFGVMWTMAHGEPHPINAPFTIERFRDGHLIDEAAAADLGVDPLARPADRL